MGVFYEEKWTKVDKATQIFSTKLDIFLKILSRRIAIDIKINIVSILQLTKLEEFPLFFVKIS
ncbi:unknown protein [Microcystis aeruginosa NIES-843]|uniref:Uncharacterized protein n=1 Tax=Microcystis aeruginosa (strain NIES-843 / IAM M-2473) TaxID=449447 RepID=B0JU58_MICAN|nr:unknown protein [Microcystis aeruginosa NIES-843]